MPSSISRKNHKNQTKSPPTRNITKIITSVPTHPGSKIANKASKLSFAKLNLRVKDLPLQKQSESKHLKGLSRTDSFTKAPSHFSTQTSAQNSLRTNKKLLPPGKLGKNITRSVSAKKIKSILRRPSQKKRGDDDGDDEGYSVSERRIQLKAYDMSPSEMK